jgi:hypothetical protein
MTDNLTEACKRVVRLQAEYDAVNHETTGATFMQEHGDKWKVERDKRLGAIDASRTYAIWALDRMLSCS